MKNYFIKILPLASVNLLLVVCTIVSFYMGDVYWVINLVASLALFLYIILNIHPNHNKKLAEIDFFEAILKDDYKDLETLSEITSDLEIKHIDIFSIEIKDEAKYLTVIKTSDKNYKFSEVWTNLDALKVYLYEELKYSGAINIVNLNEHQNFKELEDKVLYSIKKFKFVQSIKANYLLYTLFLFGFYLIASTLLVFPISILIFICFLFILNYALPDDFE